MIIFEEFKMSIDISGYYACDYTRCNSNAYSSLWFHSIHSAMNMNRIIDHYLSHFNDNLRKEIIDVIPFNVNVPESPTVGLEDNIDDFNLVPPSCRLAIHSFIDLLSSLDSDPDGMKKNCVIDTINVLFSEINRIANQTFNVLSVIADEYESHVTYEDYDEDKLIRLCESLTVYSQYFKVFYIALGKLLLVLYHNYDNTDDLIEKLEAVLDSAKLCDFASNYCNPSSTNLDEEYTTFYVNNILTNLVNYPDLKDLIKNYFHDICTSFITQAEYHERFPETVRDS